MDDSLTSVDGAESAKHRGRGSRLPSGEQLGVMEAFAGYLNMTGRQESNLRTTRSYEDFSLARTLHLATVRGSEERLQEVDDALKLILDFKGKRAYLPATYADRLLFLAHLSSQPTWVPMEEYQATAIRHSRRLHARTSLYFRTSVGLPIMLAIACASFSAFMPFPAKFTDYHVLVAICIIGNIGAFTGNVFSWLVTGINPDVSSRAANARQNAVRALKDVYDELAYELIDLYKVDARACHLIATRIDVEVVRSRMARVGASRANTDVILPYFDAVIQYITANRLPRQHLLLSYIASRHGIFEVERDEILQSGCGTGSWSSAPPLKDTLEHSMSITTSLKDRTRMLDLASLVRTWLRDAEDGDGAQLRTVHVQRKEVPDHAKQNLVEALFVPQPPEHSLGV